MTGERRCSQCGAVALHTVTSAGLLRCPSCGHVGPAASASASAEPTAAPVLFTAARTSPAPRARVLPALRARPPRRRRGGGGLAVFLAILLLVSGAVTTYLAIARSWDSGLFIPGLGGGSTRASASDDLARLPGGKPVPAVPGADGYFHRTYEWDYGGQHWSFQLNVPGDVYASYHGAPRPMRLVEKDNVLYRQMAYDVFVTTPTDDRYIEDLAGQLRQQAADKGWSDDDTLSFALAFVQSFHYATDDVTTGFDEYPRYPIETLVDGVGDCEDTAILYASLVQALGYGAVLLSPPGHMAVGVKASAGVPGTAYSYHGASYLYAETTGADWRIGDVPPDYTGQEAQIFDLVAKPLFSLAVTYGPVVAGLQHITLNASAIGSAPAYDLRLTADLTSRSESFDSQACLFTAVAPGQSVECDLRLDLRKVPRSQEVEVHSTVQDAAVWYATDDSQPWVPRP